MEFSGLKVVLVHDWLNGMRGGEKVLEYFCRIFPNAVIYTLHSEPAKVSDTILSHKIHNSFIQYIPLKKYLYRWLLPLYPMAVNSFDLKNCDLVISTSHCAVKNINVPVSVPHICYCFSPMRYAWTLNKDYFGEKGLKVFIINKILDYLKKWDFNGAKRVTSFIAVSGTVQERIAQFYGRESTVVYPPTEIIFTPQNNKEDYFLVLSALTPYKKIDIAINVCNQLNLPLKIAGSGPELNKLKKIAGKTVEFLGWVDDFTKFLLLKNARALLFPGLEDFGIVPLEAMAFATPVIGYNKGGLTETVVHGKTGYLFEEQNEVSMKKAITEFNKIIFKNEDFKNTIDKFSPESFYKQIREILRKIVK